jgi:hypothetical protein
VLISNVGMIEEYAMWHAHYHVVLSISNQRRMGCVDVQCGHCRAYSPGTHGRKEEDGLLLEFPYNPTRTRSV